MKVGIHASEREVSIHANESVDEQWRMCAKWVHRCFDELSFVDLFVDLLHGDRYAVVMLFKVFVDKSTTLG